jgi:ABC-type Mn2+/Zn2+ transport system permease subunit
VIEWLTAPLESALVTRALAELLLLSLISGVLGCWIVLRGLAYSAESLAHGMLPGVVLAALVGIPFVLGGAAGLLVAAICIVLVARIPRLDADVAVSVVITGLLGLGILLGLAPATPAGLGEILFGDVLGVSDGDLLLTGIVAVAVCALAIVLAPRLTLTCLDRLNAAALGADPRRADVALALLLALATLVAVQDLGNLLVVALLVGPAATARLVTRRVPAMMLVGVAVAALCAVAGIYASYHAELAAGASVTIAIAAAFLTALVVRGVVAARPVARGR